MVDKCPLCGSGMTGNKLIQFRHKDWEDLPPEKQECSDPECGLPVKLWAEISVLKAFWDSEHEYPER